MIAETKTALSHNPGYTGVPAASWNAKSVRLYLEERFQIKRSHTSVWQYIKALGLTWKLATKVLCKASAEERAAFIALLVLLLLLRSLGLAEIYFMDECGLKPDLDPKYGYAPCGQRLYACSGSPGRKKVNLQGLAGLDGTLEVRRLPQSGTDAETALFYNDALKKIREKARQNPATARRIRIIFHDNARFHGPLTRDAIAQNGFILIRLPRYSPDFNIVEELWHWLRCEVKANTCFPHDESLWAAVQNFIDPLKSHPETVSARLKPNTKLDPAHEKLLVGEPNQDIMRIYTKYAREFQRLLKYLRPEIHAQFFKVAC